MASLYIFTLILNFTKILLAEGFHALLVLIIFTLLLVFNIFVFKLLKLSFADRLAHEASFLLGFDLVFNLLSQVVKFLLALVFNLLNLKFFVFIEVFELFATFALVLDFLFFHFVDYFIELHLDNLVDSRHWLRHVDVGRRDHHIFKRVAQVRAGRLAS